MARIKATKEWEYYPPKTPIKMDRVTDRDVAILRKLAHRTKEIAADPRQGQRKQVWIQSNSLNRGRPPVFFYLVKDIWLEIFPDSQLQTSTPWTRYYEVRLRQHIWQFENLNDDFVVEPVIEYYTSFHAGELIEPLKYVDSDNPIGAYITEPVIVDESDIDKIIVDETVSVDWKETAERRDWVTEIFGGILEPVRIGPNLDCYGFDYYCEIRGAENALMDLALRPSWFHDVLTRLSDKRINELKEFERLGALTTRMQSNICYNSGLTFTDELPQEIHNPDHISLQDVWGVGAAQAAVSISPAMHDEFVTTYDVKQLKHFGLNTVACCETVDEKMSSYRKIRNLRRVSVSAFNDFEKVAREIGTDFVYSFKPRATAFGYDEWDIDSEKKYFKDVLDIAKGCSMEIVQNNVITCRDDPQRLTDWCNVAMEAAERF